MKKNLDYICLIDEAKLNLSSILNIKMQKYKENQSLGLKDEIINLINDRNKLFLFETKIIEKYL